MQLSLALNFRAKMEGKVLSLVRTEGMTQVVDHLPSKHKVLSSSPSTAPPKKSCHYLSPSWGLRGQQDGET
jgi:hypothetical protein